jgi:hypothetical protein
MQQRKRRMRLLSPTDPVEQRYFTQLSAAGGQHYTIPTLTIGASDDFELEFTGTFSPNGFHLFGTNTLVSQERIFITSQGDLSILGQQFNAAMLPYMPALTDGKVHVLTIRKLTTAISIKLDGTPFVNVATYGPTVSRSISRIGFRHDGGTGIPTFNGYLSDVKITINNTLVRHYPLDDDGTTNVARELVSGADGTRVNLTQASTKLFTKDGNTWVSGLTVLEIAV